MKKYLLIALGAVVLVAMLLGDAVAVAAYLGIRVLPPAAAGAPGSVTGSPMASAGASAGATAGKPAAPQTGTQTVAQDAPQGPNVAKAEFVEIPQFVVTIPPAKDSDTGSVYLQLAMSFLTEKKQAADDFTKLIPMIKAEIISDVMASGLSPATAPIKLKHEITDDSLMVANTIVSQADGSVGKTPFTGAYITSFLTQ